MKAITMEPKKGGSARMEDVVAPDAGTWTCEMAALIMKGAVSSVVRGVVLRCAAGSEAPRSDCAPTRDVWRDNCSL
jgi:hypothetical protein